MSERENRSPRHVSFMEKYPFSEYHASENDPKSLKSKDNEIFTDTRKGEVG